MTVSTVRDPHAGQPVLHHGVPLDRAKVAVIMLHGRGADATDILSLAGEFGTADVCYLAPDAAQNAWYPNRFVAPVSRNEPWLSSALALVQRTVDHVLAAGIPAERLVIAGFSQGACLALEYAARNAQTFGGVIAFAGGLIGETLSADTYAGHFGGTPIFIGVGDEDHHIPVARAEESAALLTQQGGAVDLRIYPHVPHTVIPDQINAARAILETAAARAG